jgi:hypothetical protein
MSLADQMLCFFTVFDQADLEQLNQDTGFGTPSWELIRWSTGHGLCQWASLTTMARLFVYLRQLSRTAPRTLFPMLKEQIEKTAVETLQKEIGSISHDLTEG